MPQTCTQSFDITVNGASTTDFFYWTLDEASGNRIDSVNAKSLVYTPGALTVNRFLDGDPALFSNGVHLYTLPGDSGVFNPRLDCSSIILPAAFNGFSMAFWFKIVDPKAASSTLYLTFDDGSSVQFQLSSSPNIRFQDSFATVINLGFAATTGTWYFAHVFYDFFLGMCALSLNNAAPTYTAPMLYSAAITGASVTIVGQTSYTEAYFDEFALKPQAIFTAAQVTYLYNAGAGRTWPIVLP